MVTYPRTDSRFLTYDMEGSVGALVLCCAEICDQETPHVILSAQICDSKKVSDRHAIIPTMEAS